MVAVAWLLNLDANDDLADPNRSTRSRALEARLPILAAQTGLVRPGDVLLTAGARADGLEGRAWMPTPAALVILADAGARLPAAPPLDVLARVNRRSFAGTIAALDGAGLCASIDEVASRTRAPTRTGKWLMKRAFAFGGRGRKWIPAGRLEGAALAWAKTAIARDGELWVEPFVELAGDFALHGFVDAAGALTLGSPTTQRCDELGIWRSSALASTEDLDDPERATLELAARRTAGALVRAGYFGPFGVDGFRYVGDGGALAMHAPCDVNARYTMGYAIGMAARRVDLP
jgi:hypothetical protein